MLLLSLKCGGVIFFLMQNQLTFSSIVMKIFKKLLTKIFWQKYEDDICIVKNVSRNVFCYRCKRTNHFVEFYSETIENEATIELKELEKWSRPRIQRIEESEKEVLINCVKFFFEMHNCRLFIMKPDGVFEVK